MKKWFLLSVLSLLLVACSSNSPEKVATSFLESLHKGDLESAKKYCDGSTADLLNLAQGLAGNKIKEEMANKKGEKIEIVKVEEKGDTAKVYYTTGDKKEKGNIDLKKIDGEWKVSMNKEGSKKEESMAEPSEAEVDSLSVE